MLALLPLLATLAVARPAVVSTIRARSAETPSELTGSDCISEAYYGSYGGSSETQEHIYFEVNNCLPEPKSGLIPSSEKGRIVWVGPAGVDPSSSLVKEDLSTSWASIQALARLHASSARDGQHTFSAIEIESIELIHQSSQSLLLRVPTAYLPILDTLLPAHLVPVALPTSPLPSSPTPAIAGFDTVPKHLVDDLANITKYLEFDPTLSKVLNDGIQMDSIRRDVRYLTGEGPSGIQSRHSFTAGAIQAAHWIKDKVESTGAICDLHHYMPGFSPNVICTYPSTTNSSEHVILSAHYDSRGSFGNTRAPGGDDDGSGSGHVLGVAEAIKRGGVKFDKKLQVAFFSGEEQGLFGSHAYAEFLHKTNETVILHVQADMLGYHVPGEPMQLGLPESIGTPEAAYLLGNLSHIYSPELVVGRTSACCSDHQSFHSFGFPATQVFERNGWIADPMYHNSGDLSQREGYDFDQIVSIAKVTMSAVLTVAGYSVGVGEGL